MTRLPGRRRMPHAAHLAAFFLAALAAPQASHAIDLFSDPLGDTTCGQLGQLACFPLTLEALNNGTPAGCDRGLKMVNFFCVNDSRQKASVNGWLANALRLQRDLQADLPINRLAVLGAHNAYNNIADGYILPNQDFSITDQLNMGIRRLSLDIHWFNNALRLCHGGVCSLQDRPHYQIIEELNQWLRRPENSQEVVFLDLELYLDGHQAELLAPIERHLADLVFRKSDVSDSGKLPTLDDIRNKGKRLLIMKRNEVSGDLFFPLHEANGYPNSKFNRFVSGPSCGFLSGDDWNWTSLTFVPFEPAYFSRSPDDAAPYVEFYDFYEDRLAPDSSSPGPFSAGYISPEKLKALTDCHVTHISLDRVNSDKLQPAVWSWDVNQPSGLSTENCVELSGNGRWNDTGCGELRPFACRKKGTASSPSDWRVTAAAGPWQQGGEQCQLEYGGDYTFDVPRTGHENKLLASAAQSQPVWLNLNDRAVEGVWLTPERTVKTVELRSLGKCMDDNSGRADTGARVTLWDCHGGNNQKWLLPGDRTIRSAINPNKCLDLVGSAVNGGNLVLWDCHGAGNQRWLVDGIPSGDPSQNTVGFLRSALNWNKVIDVYGGYNANGTRIQLWEYNGGGGQQWTQVPRSGP